MSKLYIYEFNVIIVYMLILIIVLVFRNIYIYIMQKKEKNTNLSFCCFSMCDYSESDIADFIHETHSRQNGLEFGEMITVVQCLPHNTRTSV